MHLGVVDASGRTLCIPCEEYVMRCSLSAMVLVVLDNKLYEFKGTLIRWLMEKMVDEP